MDTAAFLAGMAVGYRLGLQNIDLKVSVLQREIIRISVHQQTIDIDPKKAAEMTIEPEHCWDTNPYYSGWRDELDQYFHEALINE